MSCPFLKDHSADLIPQSKDGSCPAKNCPVLKKYVEEKKELRTREDARSSSVVNSESKCPYKKYHDCPYLEKLQSKYQK